MSERRVKRKAAPGDIGPASKKPAHSAPNPQVTVTYTASPNSAGPVIASTPGVSLPADLKFQAFAKHDANGDSDLLLHSSSHPSIDFTATEASTIGDKQFRHYVAVYEPISGQLEITEARKVTVRSCIRLQDHEEDLSDLSDHAPAQLPSNYSSRATLTHTFGTKKSKKIVQSRAENALLSNSGDNEAQNSLAQDLLLSIPVEDETSNTAQSTASLIQANKPLPTPDLTTSDINQVYPLSSLIFPGPVTSTLAQMSIGEWQETVAKQERVRTSSRYISNIVPYLGRVANSLPDDAPAYQPFQIARYTLMLIDLARYVQTIRPGKPIGPMAKWRTQITGTEFTPAFLDKVLRRYCPDGKGPSKYHTDLLRTTILALTLRIPPPNGTPAHNTVLIADPSEISLDLNLSPEDKRHYYRELGCRWESATDGELKTCGWKKPSNSASGIQPRFAKLKFPLEFPKMSQGRVAGGGGRKR